MIFFSVGDGAAAWQFWRWPWTVRLRPDVPPGAMSKARSPISPLSKRGSARFHRSRAARPRADPCQRAQRLAVGAPHRFLPAARVSRRPRARPRRRRHAVRAFPRSRARASCRAASPNSCARKPAPTSRANGARGDYLRLGEGEAQSGGTKKSAILGDVCEAIIGAVYLDAGFDAAQAWWSAAFLERCATPRAPLRDPKTALQEWAQARGLTPPIYRSRSARARTMRRTSSSPSSSTGFDPVEARGGSKRIAEQAAAQAFLAREGGDGQARHERDRTHAAASSR